MTTNNNLKKCAIALSLTALFGTTAAMATPNQLMTPSMQETAAKLQGQDGFGTQFIIKYKNNSDEMMTMSAAEQTPTMMSKKAKGFVKNFTSKKGKVKAQYVRA